MNPFTPHEQRFLLGCLLVLLAVTAVQLFSERQSTAVLALDPALTRGPELSTEDPARDGGKPDPNQATLPELMRVPGMTRSIAEAILWHRETRTFGSWSDLEDLPGLDEQSAMDLAAHLTFSSDSGISDWQVPPVDPNAASLSDLMALPGVGPSLARSILDNRPYSSLEDLRRVPGLGPSRLRKLERFFVLRPVPSSGAGR